MNKSTELLLVINEIMTDHYSYTMTKAGEDEDGSLHRYGHFQSKSGHSYTVTFKHDPEGKATVSYADRAGTKKNGLEGNNASKTLSTVFHMAHDHFDYHPANHITMSASKSEPSRVRLYRALIKKHFPDHDTSETDNHKSVDFHIKPKE